MIAFLSPTEAETTDRVCNLNQNQTPTTQHHSEVLENHGKMLKTENKWAEIGILFLRSQPNGNRCAHVHSNKSAPANVLYIWINVHCLWMHLRRIPHRIRCCTCSSFLQYIQQKLCNYLSQTEILLFSSGKIKVTAIVIDSVRADHFSCLEIVFICTSFCYSISNREKKTRNRNKHWKDETLSRQNWTQTSWEIRDSLTEWALRVIKHMQRSFDWTESGQIVA